MNTLIFAVLAAAPTTLIADVDYAFTDQNGVGWVRQDGNVTVTLTFAADGGTLLIEGNQKTVDGVLVRTPSGGQDLKTTPSEGKRKASFPLTDVTSTATGTTFRFDARNDHLSGSCVPAKGTQWECTFTGFQWHPLANLPELHLPLMLDAPKKKLRTVNTLSGRTDPRFGDRKVSERAIGPRR